jgi:hypothetical protein
VAEARKTAELAGSPRRPMWVREAIHLLNFGSLCWASFVPVGKKPEAMMLTVIRCGASQARLAR